MIITTRATDILKISASLQVKAKILRFLNYNQIVMIIQLTLIKIIKLMDLNHLITLRLKIGMTSSKRLI